MELCNSCSTWIPNQIPNNHIPNQIPKYPTTKHPNKYPSRIPYARYRVECGSLQFLYEYTLLSVSVFQWWYVFHSSRQSAKHITEIREPRTRNIRTFRNFRNSCTYEDTLLLVSVTQSCVFPLRLPAGRDPLFSSGVQHVYLSLSCGCHCALYEYSMC